MSSDELDSPGGETAFVNDSYPVSHGGFFRLTLIVFLVFASGMAIGRFTAGSMLDPLGDRAEAIKSCEDNFKSALGLYATRTEALLAQVKETEEKALSAIRESHEEDYKIARLALIGCDSAKR